MKQEVFQITHKDKKSNARIGILNTKSGSVETPFFMPVATKAAAKFITTPQIKEIGANVTISNAFILSLKPGTKIIKKMKGLNKFMNHHGVTFTDSGGFQMYSESIYQSSNDMGVKFRNPISGEKIFMTPEQNMQIQLDINSDVAMCLDSMPLYEDSKESIKESARKTTLWAKRCKETHDKLQKRIPKNKKQLLFGITQGGVYPDLREQSIKELAELDFDGYSIGGMGMGEKWEEEAKVVQLQKSILPENKPIYLMGIGHPIEILNGISEGVDIFDSRLPTQNARRGTLFTSKGRLRLLNKKHEFSKKPIDKNCNCQVCQNYTRSYLRHLLNQQEPLGKQLATYHNLYFLTNLIKQAKQEIKKGTFNKFKNKFIKNYKD